MNSRQIRKRDAARHNMAIDEREAYKQDRIEDPNKYKRRTFRTAEESLAAHLIMTIGHIANE